MNLQRECSSLFRALSVGFSLVPLTNIHNQSAVYCIISILYDMTGAALGHAAWLPTTDRPSAPSSSGGRGGRRSGVSTIDSEPSQPPPSSSSASAEPKERDLVLFLPEALVVCLHYPLYTAVSRIRTSAGSHHHRLGELLVKEHVGIAGGQQAVASLERGRGCEETCSSVRDILFITDEWLHFKRLCASATHRYQCRCLPHGEKERVFDSLFMSLSNYMVSLSLTTVKITLIQD